MTSKVILKKKMSTDPFGYLSIRYFNGNGKKKVISLGEKISTKDFDDFYSSEYGSFKITTKIDYKLFNKKINEKINDFSVFEEKTKKVECKSSAKSGLI